MIDFVHRVVRVFYPEHPLHSSQVKTASDICRKCSLCIKVNYFLFVLTGKLVIEYLLFYHHGLFNTFVPDCHTMQTK